MSDDVERLRRRLDRERRARLEAERIAEARTAELYSAAMEAERAREEQEQASQELEALVRTITHDLRTPLITTLAFLELLDGDVRDELEPEQVELLDGALRNGAFLKQLLADLLELARAGRASSSESVVDLGALVRAVAADLASTGRRLAIEVGDLPGLIGPEVRLRQLVTNLLANAVNHGGVEELRVSVTAEVGGDGRLDLRVQDNGRGVDPSERDDLFRPFKRGKTEADGTGLGLAICRRIVASLGGTISFAEVDEPGACVVIGLPADRIASA